MVNMSTTVETIVIGLGEWAVRKNDSAALTCVGLGSCIALCAYDPVAKVGGMAHMVLPSNESGTKIGSAKYVDTGIPMLLEEMKKQGALISRTVIKIAGGAQMLSVPGLNGRLNVADRNIAATKTALAQAGVSAAGAELGGSSGRTVQLFLESGRVTVRATGKETCEL